MTGFRCTERAGCQRVAAAWIACLRLCLTVGLACADEPRPRAEGASASTGTRRALIICGLPGDDAHRKLFDGVVEKLPRP